VATIEKRTAEDGTTSYRVKVRIKGHPVATATCPRLTDARRLPSQTEAAIREWRYFKTLEAQKHTFGDLVDRYIRDVLPAKPKSQAKQTAQLTWWKAELGAYALADVTPALIAEARDKLQREPIPNRKKKPDPNDPPRYRDNATIVRYLAALSHALSIAVKEWGWIEDNPVGKVSKPKEPRGRVRLLSDDERERLLAACKTSSTTWLYPVVVLGPEYRDAGAGDHGADLGAGGPQAGAHPPGAHQERRTAHRSPRGARPGGAEGARQGPAAGYQLALAWSRSRRQAR